MARTRQWYEDVMDVALRATLKEFGFKRKSHATYICEHSPDRVWIFEIENWRTRNGFYDWTAIFVPQIEDIVTRLGPGIGTYDTRLRNPSQFKISIGDLIQAEQGWDDATWQNNPKSDHWLWGPRAAPEAGKIVPIMDGDSWGSAHTKAFLMKGRSAEEIVLRNIELYNTDQYTRDWNETAEAVGRELDRLWRSSAYEWLQKCDDPHYLAEWLDKYVCSWRSLPAREPCAFTAAAAWHLAGESSRASEILNGIIAKFETSNAATPDNGVQLSDHARRIVDGARKLADEFGVRLE